ncbi:MAG: hypothetical protein LBS01_03505 [Prevotellaceae bacterium]|nr:hypothetical protein [Prevotellaceae bacterium]
MLIEHNKYDEAKLYIEKLVRDYGYTVEYIEREGYFAELEKNIDWNKFKQHLSQLNNNFYSKVDTALVVQLADMCIIDQTVRNKTQYNRKLMEETDSINEQKIKYIFDNYGYPDEKLVGLSNKTIFKVDISTMLMHFSDTAYFRPKLLEFIRKGECQPVILGNFIDSYQRRDTAKLKYVYGIYSNSLDKVKDFQNMDVRRKSIGMPTLAMQQKRDSLINIRFAHKAGDIEIIVNGRGDTIEVKHF